jgi:hypothetical protein
MPDRRAGDSPGLPKIIPEVDLFLVSDVDVGIASGELCPKLLAFCQRLFSGPNSIRLDC